jgi:UDP-glucose 4-epimerase
LKVVITGAAGFIGQYTVLELHARGHHMVLFSRDRKKLDSAFYSNHIPYELVETDYRSGLDRILKNADALVHLAGLRHQKDRPMIDYIMENMVLTDRLLQACIQNGVRNIVFASSRLVYNPDVNALPFTENQDCSPATPYGISKLACEKMAHYCDAKFGTRTKCLRIGQVAGPEEPEEFMVGTFIRQAQWKQPITVWGKGLGARDYVYVKDVARAIALAVESPDLSGTFNISCGEPISHLRFAESVNRAFGNRGNLKMAPEKKEDMVPFFMSPARAERELKWKPKWNIDAMLDDMARDIGK